jgi:hypothetical protein
MANDREDPYQFRPGDLPTPFSATEIRVGCPPGRTVRSLVEQAGQEPYIGVTKFVTGDEDGADQEFWRESPDRTRLTEPQRRRSTWLEFQGHASMPAAQTTRTEETIDIPAGRFECMKYVRRDEDGVATFWFARVAPGMPLKFQQQVDGQIVFASTAITDEVPAPGAD